MKIIGIDLSAESKNTSVCVIDISQTVIEEPKAKCDNDSLKRIIQDAQVIGVDAPFGWPENFRRVVNNNSISDSDWEDRPKLRLRCTDQCLKTYWEDPNNGMKGGPNPLSVSSDKIAVAAWRAMALLHHFRADSDRSGLQKFEERRWIEVYPAASLHFWKIKRTRSNVSYKRASPEAKELRIAMIEEIKNATNTKMSIPAAYADSDHNLDALIAALTAYAACKGQTLPPNQSQMSFAKTEGWIHLPSQALADLSWD